MSHGSHDIPAPGGHTTMTEDNLQRIERAIGRRLSPALRRFYLAYPSELRTTFRTLLEGYGEDVELRECPADRELLDRADDLIAVNTPDQKPAVMGWTANCFVVGMDPDFGIQFWVDLDDPRAGVFRYETTPGGIQDSDRIADTIDDFARGLLNSYRNFGA